MYNQEQINFYINLIKEIIKQKPTAYCAILKNKKYLDVLTFINEMTPKLADDCYNLSTKLYWILNDLHDFPICPICGKKYGEKINVPLNRGYLKTCSVSCGSIGSLQKKRETCMERYGVDNPAKSQIIKNKINETCMERYGTKIANQHSSEEFFKKYQNTCLQKYGVSSPLLSPLVQEKIKNTLLEKYGVDNVFKSSQIRQKIKQTCLEKFGFQNPNKNKDVRNKIEKTCLERYGAIVSTKNQAVKEKIKNTLMEKYGVNSPMQLDIFKERNQISKAKRRYDQFLKSQNIIPLFSFQQFVINKNDLYYEYSWKCNSCREYF